MALENDRLSVNVPGSSGVATGRVDDLLGWNGLAVDTDLELRSLASVSLYLGHPLIAIGPVKAIGNLKYDQGIWSLQGSVAQFEGEPVSGTWQGDA